MTIRDICLVVFISVTWINVTGIMLDVWLRLEGILTVSEIARTHRTLGSAIIAMNVIGVFALVLHFYHRI